MTQPQAAFWDGVFSKMVQMPKWKAELDVSLQEFVYLNSRESLKYCEDQNQNIAVALNDLGLLKQ